MTTELATVQPTEPQPGMSELMQWAMDARQASQVARSLATTSFVPASLRVEPRITPRMSAEEEAAARDAALTATAANITGAILTGTELGLQPMAALRSLDIIQGTPALRAHAMRGLVQSRGHQVELVESTPDRCVMRGRRRATGALVGGFGDWQQVTWTVDRAQQLGLTGKDQWKKQPQTMLVARATGELCRLIAADALFAVPYAAEELDGAPPPERALASSSAPVTAAEIMGKTDRPAAPTPEAEPVAPEPAAEAVPPEAAPPGQSALGAALTLGGDDQ